MNIYLLCCCFFKEKEFNEVCIHTSILPILIHVFIIHMQETLNTHILRRQINFA